MLISLLDSTLKSHVKCHRKITSVFQQLLTADNKIPYLITWYRFITVKMLFFRWLLYFSTSLTISIWGARAGKNEYHRTWVIIAQNPSTNWFFKRSFFSSFLWNWNYDLKCHTINRCAFQKWKCSLVHLKRRSRRRRRSEGNQHWIRGSVCLPTFSLNINILKCRVTREAKRKPKSLDKDKRIEMN